MRRIAKHHVTESRRNYCCTRQFIESRGASSADYSVRLQRNVLNLKVLYSVSLSTILLPSTSVLQLISFPAVLRMLQHLCGSFPGGDQDQPDEGPQGRQAGAELLRWRVG